MRIAECKGNMGKRRLLCQQMECPILTLVELNYFQVRRACFSKKTNDSGQLETCETIYFSPSAMATTSTDSHLWIA